MAMKKGILGIKLGMTQVFRETGEAVPVTAIEAGPCTVLALRTAERDGYNALQLGFGRSKAKNLSRAERGHVKAAGLAETPPAFVREIRLAEPPDKAVGEAISVALFAADEYVDVVGQSKGRGFQGVVKRWHFAGGRASHGGGWVRRTGSIGMKARPGKVYKKRKMPGHMGNVQRTVQNLQIVAVRPDENLILVRGSVPGPNGGLVLVCSARKKA